MRTTPAATIAMVTYNSASYLCDAIDSVLAQDYEDFELLICDDASHDQTWEIVTSYDDPRIRAVRNDTNLGEYRNRNKALGLARGAYIMFLDGDDYLYPQGLGFMLRMMRQFPSVGFGAALQACEKFIYPVQLKPREFCSCAYFGPSVIAADFTQLFFHTESLRKMGGFSIRYRTGDRWIQFAMGMKYNVVLIPAGQAWWRRRRGQASERLSQTGAWISETFRFCRDLIGSDECPLAETEKAIARANLARLVLRNAAMHVVRGKLRNAFDLLNDSRVPLADWHHVLTRHQAHYLAEVSGENPVRYCINGAIARSASHPSRAAPVGTVAAMGAAD